MEASSNANVVGAGKRDGGGHDGIWGKMEKKYNDDVAIISPLFKNLGHVYMAYHVCNMTKHTH